MMIKQGKLFCSSSILTTSKFANVIFCYERRIRQLNVSVDRKFLVFFEFADCAYELVHACYKRI